MLTNVDSKTIALSTRMQVEQIYLFNNISSSLQFASQWIFADTDISFIMALFIYL